MSEKRFLAILSFLLALIGGVLVLADALNLPRRGGFTGRELADTFLGVAAIFGGVSIFRGRMAVGGLVTLVIGIALIILGAALLEAVLIIVGGVLGVVGAEVRR